MNHSGKEQSVTRRTFAFDLRSEFVGIVAGIMLFISGSGVARENEVWLAALPRAQEGYVALFEHRSQWQDMASQVRVFQVHIGILKQIADDRLRTLITLLSSAGIKLAIVSPVLPISPGCFRFEAQIEADGLRQSIARIHSMGGAIDYLAMDEPVWYGGVAPKPKSCAANGGALARAATDALKEVQRTFPSVQFGVIEPTDVPAAALGEFVTELGHSGGIRISFLHLDVDWKTDWQRSIREWGKWAKARGITRGVIFDGGSWQTDDALWETTALARFKSAASGILEPSDQVIFQAWEKSPSRYLPTAQYGTLLNFVSEAFKYLP